MGKTKRDVRRVMRARIRELAPEPRFARSLAACRWLRQLDEFRGARRVFVFLGLGSEIDTTAVVEQVWREGATVLVPRVIPTDREMEAVEIRSWSDVTPGYRGILEPVCGGAARPGSIDLAIVPGLAFDASGRRLGRGGGYYDRFLAQGGFRATMCGFGFANQFIESLPVEGHDVDLDLIVTERGFVDCRTERTVRSALPGR